MESIFNEEDFNNGLEEITTDFGKMMLDSYVDPNAKIETQPIAISIGSSLYKGNDYPISFGSYGDFSCIVASSKARKTFFKSMLEAGYIGGSANILNPSIKGHSTQDRYVIQFDTEQSKFHTQRVVHRVCDMVGGVPDNFKSYALRAYPPLERMQFIDWIVYESEFKNQIGLMTIDGYVDLVTDFNDLEQATRLTEKLMQWTSIKGLKPYQQMHITGVLHKNFGTNKPVGHVGSAVLKKAETIAFLDNDQTNGFTKVICEYSRNLPFKSFEFGVDENWLPYENQEFVELPVTKTKQGGKKDAPF